MFSLLFSLHGIWTGNHYLGNMVFIAGGTVKDDLFTISIILINIISFLLIPKPYFVVLVRICPWLLASSVQFQYILNKDLLLYDVWMWSSSVFLIPYPLFNPSRLVPHFSSWHIHHFVCVWTLNYWIYWFSGVHFIFQKQKNQYISFFLSKNAHVQMQGAWIKTSSLIMFLSRIKWLVFKKSNHFWMSHISLSHKFLNTHGLYLVESLVLLII